MSTVLSPEAAHDLVVDALTRCGAGRAQARTVAAALVGAELTGQRGHGLARLPAYAEQVLAGKIDGRAEPVVTEPRPGTLAIDAGHGFAYPALERAVAALPAMARAQGIAMAGIRRSHHAGVSGLVVEALARDGLAALMLVNTPSAIAPWGGRRALLGTNPIAFAAPVEGAEPVVIDLSVSQVARGKVMAAVQRGEAIPEGWALDSAGRPTTDPEAALAGTMVALGGAKGAALALMVEILAAGLTGARFAYEASSFLDADGAPPGTGQLLLGIDPAAFGSEAPARIAALAAAIESEGDARLPGRRRQSLRAGAEGIAIDAELRARIEALGR